MPAVIVAVAEHKTSWTHPARRIGEHATPTHQAGMRASSHWANTCNNNQYKCRLRHQTR